uniref:Reverse transcriptase domain-containing protein n=1 Tax=Tanacetum cinerariifolium TaxID=118510 RepID=A0A699JRC6_TANCI|nr:reverse transcriptase domain-containing protein [Tanacetum cinerariifolium]
MEKFFQIFHDLHFDISFANALILMPKFASTIKSLLANKDKLFELAKVPLNENCSAMLLKKLLEKLGDPELNPIRMTLELADRSITRPKGVAEDVFVKVGKFYFPTDFAVVDFKADPRVPLILGRSFLRSGRALIDVYGEEITLRVNDESVTSVKRVNVINIASEEVVQDNSKSSNPTLVSESDFCEDPIVKTSPFGENNESEYNEPIKDDSSAFTTFTNLLFDDKDDFTIHDGDVPIEESKVYSNSRFDNDEIYSNELESHFLNVESNFVESLSNHDTVKFDHLEEFSGALMPIHIVEEELIRKEHTEYISLIERRRIFVLEGLRVDNSISNYKNELSDNEASDFDNLSFPRPPPEPPDAEFDFKPDTGEEISVVMNNNDELKCLDPRDEIDVSTNDEDDDYFPFMFVI